VSAKTDKPIILITLGDINGVGPEVTMRALADPAIQSLARYVIVGDYAVISSVIDRFASGLDATHLDSLEDIGKDSLGILSDNQTATAHEPGQETAEAGAAAHRWICRAADACMNGQADGMVTAPISKAAVLKAGLDDMGHTELLARLTGTDDWRMSLFFDEKLVVHLTGHLPLRDALDAIRASRIEDTIRITHDALRHLGIEQPRIAVPGLNPHAGEQGALGREDLDEVAPAVAAAVADGIDCTGPVSPDAVFRQLLQNQYDAVVALYHDQGHIPIKLVAMERGVNVTLGLPIIRTSPDHGTAYDIAWKNIADPSSMKHALRLAARMAAGKRSAARS